MQIDDAFNARLAHEIRERLHLQTDPITDAELLERTKGSFTYQASVTSLRLDDAVRACVTAWEDFKKAVVHVAPN